MNHSSDTAAETAPMLVELIARLEERAAGIEAQLAEICSALQGAPAQSLLPTGAPATSPIPVTTAEKHATYKTLIDQLREVVLPFVPVGATMAVISKGDPELLQMDGRRCWHFPQNARGQYAGFHPADSAAAIAHLEEMRALGAEYLLIPQTALWWLEHYREFRQHLETNYAFLLEDAETCALVRLQADSAAHEARGLHGGGRDGGQQLRAVVRSIVPDGARVLVINDGDRTLLALDDCQARGFPSAPEGSGAPRDSAETINLLNEEIQLGAEYLIVPACTAWWLEQHPGFARHIETHHRLVARQKHVAFIFEFNASTAPHSSTDA